MHNVVKVRLRRRSTTLRHTGARRACSNVGQKTQHTREYALLSLEIHLHTGCVLWDTCTGAQIGGHCNTDACFHRNKETKQTPCIATHRAYTGAWPGSCW